MATIFDSKASLVYHGAMEQRKCLLPQPRNAYLWSSDAPDSHFMQRYTYIHKLDITKLATPAYLDRLLDDDFIEQYERSLRRFRVPAQERDEILSSLVGSKMCVEVNCDTSSLEVDFWSLGHIHLMKHLSAVGHSCVRLENGHPWMCILDPSSVKIVSVAKR